jgi:hypothetical protein
MSQFAASDGQPGNWEEPGFFLRRLETVRYQENGWQEPHESRGSRTELRGTGGEIPPVYPTTRLRHHAKTFDIRTIFGFLSTQNTILISFTFQPFYC